MPSLYQQRKDRWISTEKFSLSISDISKIVESYNLDETTGVGFVVIAENFNKKCNCSSAYYTFFDIASREILWATWAQKEATGFGWTVYWMRGITDAFDIFERDVYLAHRRG